VALETLDIDDLLSDDNGMADILQSQIAEQQASIERAQTALQRTDDAFFDGLMDDDRYRRQVARLRAQVDAASAEIERLSTKYDAEADRAKRRRRIESVSANGLAILNGDATTGNAWLRQHVRLWVESGRVTDVEWL
jgi:chromosome segregation ATPase